LKTFKLHIASLFIFNCYLTYFAQENTTVSFFENGIINYSKKYKKYESEKTIKSVIDELIQDGYFNTSLDSIKTNIDSVKIYITTGEIFTNDNITIKFNQQSNSVLSDFFEKKNFNINPLKFYSGVSKSLNYLNNNGYPFAKLEFHKSVIEKDKLIIDCEIDTGPYVVFDSIYNDEMSNKELKLIYKLTKIKNGKPFNLMAISKANEILNRTTYYSVKKPIEYEFVNERASIYTYIKSKANNNINGLLGLQPNSSGELQLTGNVSLNFLNSMKSGEMLSLNWRKMFNQSQNLITQFSIPYILGSNLEFDGKLNMIKKDSSFLNLNLNGNFNYLINNFYRIGVVYNISSSTNLLLNQYNSTSVKNFGFILCKNKLNNSFNPTKGFYVKSVLTTGTKSTYLNQNDQEIELKTPDYFASIKYTQYFNIKNRTAFKYILNGSTTINDNLFENELSRIGGYNNLRGFDGESIFVSSYLINTFEVIYLLEESSNIFLFTDLAITEKKTNLDLLTNNYHSVGVGVNLSLNNGFLTIIYGLGRETKQNFLIRTGKIHLGFTSFF
tara:strand:- start:2650 stop:4317 length:1668 start_codon:yes stop_codon:yes gene_type:complete